MPNSGKSRSFETAPLPTYRATCDTCGWEGPEQSFKTITTWQLETHECEAP